MSKLSRTRIERELRVARQVYKRVWEPRVRIAEEFQCLYQQMTETRDAIAADLRRGLPLLRYMRKLKSDLLRANQQRTPRRIARSKRK